jgi:TolB protein
MPTVTAESPNEPAATESPPSSVPDRLIEGRIAVVDNSSQLWTVAPDGSDRRPLSDQRQFYQFPSWSPAGNDIAVIASDSEASGVYVVTDAPGSEMRQLYSDTSSLPIYLYWSPEGKQVSFIASHNEGLALHLAPADGSAASELLATSPSTFFWDWMPDGSQVLIHTGFAAIERDNSRLAMVRLDDSLLTQEIAEGGYYQAPAVAADGAYFSFGSLDEDGNRWLSIQDVEQGEKVETVRHQGVLAMAFSPSSAQLAFTSPARPSLSFYGALRLIDLETGEPRLLVPEPVVAFFWSPDGRSIAYMTPTIIDKPFDFDDAPVAGLSGQSTRAKPGLSARAKLGAPDAPGLLLQPETEFGLALSIVEVESGESRLLTTFKPGALFLDQFLPFFDQYAHSHRLWSPDSRALLLPIRDEQDQDMIIVVPADGNDPWPISPGVAAFWSQQ